MKKLIILFAFLLGTLSMANLKDDYDGAKKLFEQNNINEGLKLLEEISKTTDYTEDELQYVIASNYVLGSFYQSQQDVNKAKGYYSTALDFSKKDKSILQEGWLSAIRLGQISEYENKFEEAEKYYIFANDYTKNENPSTVSTLLLFYLRNESDSYIEKGEELYNKIMNSSNKSLIANVNLDLGDFVNQYDDFENALSFYGIALKEGDTKQAFQANHRIAQTYIKENKATEAEKYLLEMETLTESKNLDALTLISKYYVGMDQMNKAESYLQKMLTLTKNGNPGVLVFAGEFYQLKGDLKTAENYFKSADDFFKGENMETKQKLIDFYMESSQIDKAENTINELLKETKNQNPNVLFSAAMLYEKKGDLKTAEKYLLELNTLLDGKNQDVLKGIGQFYLKHKNYNEAEKMLLEAKKLNPKDQTVLLSLIELYEMKKETANVTKQINELKKLSPKSLNTRLGIYFAEKDNLILSEKYLRRAITIDKENEAKFFLGQVLYELGRKDEAKKYLKDAQNNGVEGAEEYLKKIEKEGK